MASIDQDELEWLLTILNEHPRESLRSISEKEGVEYHRLKRVYDKYYGKYVFVSAIYDIVKLGLKSYVAFLSVPKVELMTKAKEILKNPFIAHITPIFGFKNGIQAILHVPVDQEKYIPEMLSKYSNDFEFYEVWARKREGNVKFGKWQYSYEYALLLDALKVDARTPMKELEALIGRKRPTIKFMINKLIEDGIIIGFYAYAEHVEPVYDRSFIGIAQDIDIDEFLRKFQDIEIKVGVLKPKGYYLEWFFSSKDDMGSKILEFSPYVEKLAIGYLDMFQELNNEHLKTRFSRMVRKDGKGYRSILEF
ncbi:transcriptional regulator [Thermococcus chitonophagus]|uniref:Putative HTH transcription regulator n=1 Tax=Thermococcus chitonophagus TaxID=54262 RepID=A0A160VQT6_9EURY|nr:Lrp/AsnC family transcriptional regulator [Thermococcus chitonophagus]ASJ15992.1 transcriptional regulator [Thermococcus chitonophagus]CUX77237.1 putative HTH transcription regulator [Thermococcus chitonophagus]